MTIGVNQKIAPITFAFLIKADDPDRFVRAMEIAFGLWGGMFAPIIPFYAELPDSFRKFMMVEISTKDFYANTFNNYDSDIILYDDDLAEAEIQEIMGERHSIKISEFLDNLVNGHSLFGVNVLQVASHIIKKEFKFQRNDNLQIVLPLLNESGPFLKAFVGSLASPLQKKLREQLEGASFFNEKSVHLDKLSEYYNSDFIDIIGLNYYKLKSWSHKPWLRGSGIFILDINSLAAVMNFWNLRALGWDVVPLPVSMLDDPYFYSVIERSIRFRLNDENRSSFFTVLHDYTFTKIHGEKVALKLKDISLKFEDKIHFSYQQWFPRYWEQKNVLEADHAVSSILYIDSYYEHLELKDGNLKVKTRAFPFPIGNTLYQEATFKCNLSFSYTDEFADKAGVISGITTQQWLQLSGGFGMRHWRLSKNGINYFVRDDDDEINLFIPDALEFFKQYFNNLSFSLKETSNGKLAKEVLKNIGGIRGTYLFRGLSSLKIIELFENGKFVYFDHLVSEIKKNLRYDNNQVVNLVERLLGNKIIEFGAALQCGVCDQYGFHLPEELGKENVCPVCRNKFLLPMAKPGEIKWAYRGIGPFSRNNKVDGIMCVFLCLRLFNNEFANMNGNMSSLMGFILTSKKIEKEIDLAVLLKERYDEDQQPDFFFCECKTYKQISLDDIERMKYLGEKFPNAILVFATLNQRFVDDETKALKGLVQYFQTGEGNRPRNPILLLTASELLPPIGYRNAFSMYEDKIKPYKRANDWIGSICEMTVARHLNIETWGSIRTKKWHEAMRKRNEFLDKLGSDANHIIE